MRVIIFLALCSTSALALSRQGRIVGGEPTTIEQYPYMSNMQYHWWGFFWLQSCGGSLITTTSVLSAAHCYEGDLPSQWRVRLGSTFASSGGQLITVTGLTLHAGYNANTFENDIAIVNLASAAVLSSSVGVARIAGPGYILPDLTIVSVIGWGDQTYQGVSSEVLRHVDVNIINQETCAQRYAYLKSLPGYQAWPDITSVMVCTGILDVGGRDACQGDSGGPVAHDSDVIIGITSWGFRCADEYYPGVNARVSSYTDWIVANA